MKISREIKSVIGKVTCFSVLFLCFILCFTNSLFSQSDSIDFSKPQEYTIKGIDVNGTEYTDKRILISLTGLHVDDKIKIPGEELAKAIKTLWKQRLFTDVSIDVVKIVNSEVFLRVNVEERPRISKYTFKGIKNSDAEELKKKMDMHAGMIFTDYAQSKAVNVIKNYYIDKGYLSTKVDVELKQDTITKSNVNIIPQFIVNKGPQVKIAAVELEGVHALSESQVRSKMKDTKEKIKFDLPGIFQFKKNFQKEPNHPRWYHILGNLAPTRMYEYLDRFVNLNMFKASKFKRATYEEDKKKVLDFYASKGYRDAKISYDTVIRADEKNLVIKIKIDEGRQYYFRNIFFNGNTKYPDSLLTKIVSIKKGEIYNQKALDEKLFSNPNGGDLSSLYMDDGYLFFSVTPHEVRIDGDSVDIELRISEGPQATINEVRILGNTKTNEKVIRRELRTLPGNKFSRSDLIRSQREIIALGYFDPQQLDVVPIPNPEKGTVDIEYRVTEKPSDQLELSAGYGGKYQGVVGTLGVTFTNFSVKNIFDKKAWAPLPSGDGQRLSVRVQSSGRTAQFYTVSFTEPWLGGKRPNSLTIAFNRTRFNNVNNFSDNKITGSYFATSATVAYGTRLKWPDDYFTAEVALTYQNYTMKNYGFILPAFTNGSSHNLNLSLHLGRNSLDQMLYPKHGSNFSFTAMATLPYSKMFPSIMNLNFDSISVEQKYKMTEFFKFKFTAEWYTTLVQNLVLKGYAKFGFLGYYNSKIGLPLFERFEVGGDGLSNTGGVLGRDIISQRGYEVYTPTQNAYTTVYGAAIYNKFGLELRYPISLNPSATIFGLVFAEGGNAWQRAQDYRPYELRKSIGIGLRVFLPMFGLLGVDYGFPLDKFIYPNGTAVNTKGRPSIILGQQPE